MSRIKRYDFEQYSIFDIKKYLENKGYKVEMSKVRYTKDDAFHVVDTDIFVDIPSIDINGLIFAEIRFEDYPRTENYEKSKKLYAELKRKFAVKDSTWPKNIKDRDKMVIKDYSK